MINTLAYIISTICIFRCPWFKPFRTYVGGHEKPQSKHAIYTLTQKFCNGYYNNSFFILNQYNVIDKFHYLPFSQHGNQNGVAYCCRASTRIVRQSPVLKSQSYNNLHLIRKRFITIILFQKQNQRHNQSGYFMLLSTFIA